MSATTGSGPRRSRSRRMLFVLLGLLVVVLGIELMCWLAFSAVTGRSFSWSALQRERATIAAGGDERAALLNPAFALHPYLGFVGEPEGLRGIASASVRDLEVDHGFLDREGPLRRRGPSKLVVAIVGGSVAASLSVEGALALAAELRASSPSIAGREIEFVRLALAGYKQPQQLLQITYLLSLGAEFDVVINLDGFNEIVLPWIDNFPQGIYPFFPSTWATFATAPSRDLSRRIGRLDLALESRRKRAQLFSRAPLRLSVLANLLWAVTDGRAAAAIAAQRMAIKGIAREPSFALTGPRTRFGDEAETYDALAAVWRESSLQLARACAANDVRYVHFLQPNQYVPGSKPLSEDERESAFLATTTYRYAVETGYPVLRAAGLELEDAGVAFHDLTAVFASTVETVYVDNCCHLNARGNEILGGAIGALVGVVLERDPIAESGNASTLPAGSRLDLTPAECTLRAPFESAAFVLAARGPDGEDVSLVGRHITFRSDAKGVARVSRTGRVRAIAPGVATVTAEAGGRSATAIVRVAFDEAVRYGVGSPGTGGRTPDLQAACRDGARVSVEVRGARPGAAATVLVALRPDDAPWCGSRMHVPVGEAIVVPASVGSDGVLEMDFPLTPDLRGRTLYLQVSVQDPNANCRWSTTNGFALRVE